jgi:hypothetical protein
MAGDPAATEKTSVAREAPRAGPTIVAPRREIRPGSEAAAQALAALAYGEAPRIGCLGDPGGGKTVAMRYLVAEYVRRSLGWVLIVDDKDPGRPQFEGQLFVDVVDVAVRGLQPEPRVIVFRGDTKFGRDCEPDEIARFAWSMKTKGLPTLVVYDELKHRMLVNYGVWVSGVEWVPRTFEKGRGVGIGSLWGAQFPQQVPPDPFETTPVILCFKLAGQGLAKLRERGYLSAGVEEVIRTLKGDGSPPEERGEFVLLWRGREWDGNVYRFAA